MYFKKKKVLKISNVRFFLKCEDFLIVISSLGQKNVRFLPRFLVCRRNYYFPRILSIYPREALSPEDKLKESEENNNF